MASKTRLSSVEVGNAPAFLGPCHCRLEFYRQELARHHACLELQREYYSETAIALAEEAVARLVAQLDQLCQRDDACEVMSRLLRQLDSVTRLSAWTDPSHLH